MGVCVGNVLMVFEVSVIAGDKDPSFVSTAAGVNGFCIANVVGCETVAADASSLCGTDCVLFLDTTPVTAAPENSLRGHNAEEDLLEGRDFRQRAKLEERMDDSQEGDFSFCCCFTEKPRRRGGGAINL